MSALSQKPPWVEFIEKGTHEVLGICHRCKEEVIFEGDEPLERGINWALIKHGECKEGEDG